MTTCTMPSWSRRSIKTTPPWSRRVSAHPHRVTDWPIRASSTRPQRCVRIRENPRGKGVRMLENTGRVRKRLPRGDPCPHARGDRVLPDKAGASGRFRGITMNGKLGQLAALVAAFGAGTAAAADYGSYSYEGETVTLTHGCTVVPHVDAIGFGKPEAIVLLASQPLDCDAYASWVIPGNGAFGDVVRRGDGGLLQIDVGPGPKVSRITVSGGGYTLGNDSCEGCASNVAYAGDRVTGTLATATPLMDGKIVIDAKFDLPKPAGPAKGE